MMAETGATASWCEYNVRLAAAMLREAAAMATQIAGETIPSDTPGRIAMTVRQPAGVVLGIAPWNAPVILGVRAIAMPLACGNTVILKASELCPATHRLIGTALRDAGLPQGRGQCGDACAGGCRQGDGDADRASGGAPHQLHRLDAASGGSWRKPRRATSSRSCWQLSGKAPLIVLDDADLDEAAKAAAFGAFVNQGQVCMSTERIVVDETVADAFIDKARRAGTRYRWRSARGESRSARWSTRRRRAACAR